MVMQAAFQTSGWSPWVLQV